jgi:Ferritin-like domain
MVILVDESTCNSHYYVIGSSRRQCSLSRLLPRTAYKFDIKRARQVNRMALLDAENLKSAALVHTKPQTAPKQCVETITEIGHPRDPAVALYDSNAITVIPRHHNSEQQKERDEMEKEKSLMNRSVNRRSLLKTGALAGGAVALGAGLAGNVTSAFAEEGGNRVTKDDIAILTFLSALEQVEADLWIQYAELGGATNQGLSPIDVPFKSGLAPAYITGLLVLDGDMPQYISDNTDDEISHHRFLNNYLQSKGAKPIDLSNFAILPPSEVTGVPQNGRLTNLKQLTIDTSWWTRYRSANKNPDLGGKFENAVPDLAKGQHPAIPLSDADLVLDSMGNISNHLQAIANTAGFHFAFIEQGGSSLYPTLAQKVTDLEVLRVLLSIGGSEIMHFQTWQDKAGNATNITDGSLTFPNLNIGVDPNNGATGANIADLFQTNLIMPEPTVFLDPKLGPVSIIRPTSTAQGGAVASVASFVADGLFLDPATGKNTGIVNVLMRLAEEADEARRRF